MIHGQRTPEDLNLQVDMAAQWSLYTKILNSAIALHDCNDELKWCKSKANGVLITKPGYKAFIEDYIEEEWEW